MEFSVPSNHADISGNRRGSLVCYRHVGDKQCKLLIKGVVLNPPFFDKIVEGFNCMFVQLVGGLS